MTESLHPSSPVRRVPAPPVSESTARHEISVEINGETIEAEVESRLLLTDFLRDRVRLTGTHVGCEQGSCGACTRARRRPSGAVMSDVGAAGRWPFGTHRRRPRRTRRITQPNATGIL